MKEDVPGDVHRKLYAGKSDKANALANQNREFLEGYRVGAESMTYCAEHVLKEELALRVEVGDCLMAGFDEWKRGFWAARSQCILFRPRTRKRTTGKFFGERSGK